MGKKEREDELNGILARLRSDASVRKVILFGSMARGDTHEWSDIDLIIVKDTDKKFLDRLDEFYTGPSEPKDILVYTPEEFEYMKERPFVKNALKEGKVLYEA